MSFFSNLQKGSIDLANLFSNDRNKPKSQVFRGSFTTTQTRIDTEQRLGMVYIRAVIDNQDPTNSLTIRTEPQAPTITIPPNSVLVLEDEVHSFLEINPNAATGVGDFSLQTADPDGLRKSGFLGI